MEASSSEVFLTKDFTYEEICQKHRKEKGVSTSLRLIKLNCDKCKVKMDCPFLLPYEEFQRWRKGLPPKEQKKRDSTLTRNNQSGTRAPALSHDTVRKIRRLHAVNEDIRQTAELTGLDRRMIRKVVMYETYKNVI